MLMIRKSEKLATSLDFQAPYRSLAYVFCSLCYALNAQNYYIRGLQKQALFEALVTECFKHGLFIGDSWSLQTHGKYPLPTVLYRAFIILHKITGRLAEEGSTGFTQNKARATETRR